MKKILFIEDEDALQKAVKFILENNGYDFLSALDGEIGVVLAKTEKPDLILLDLILPKINGFEVLESLLSDESTKNIPVIVLTNLEGSADVEKALSLGAKTYLVKSNYSLGDILEKVKRVLED